MTIVNKNRIVAIIFFFTMMFSYYTVSENLPESYAEISEISETSNYRSPVFSGIQRNYGIKVDNPDTNDTTEQTSQKSKVLYYLIFKDGKKVVVQHNSILTIGEEKYVVLGMMKVDGRADGFYLQSLSSKTLIKLTHFSKR